MVEASDLVHLGPEDVDRLCSKLNAVQASKLRTLREVERVKAEGPRASSGKDQPVLAPEPNDGDEEELRRTKKAAANRKKREKKKEQEAAGQVWLRFVRERRRRGDVILFKHTKTCLHTARPFVLLKLRSERRGRVQRMVVAGKEV